MMRECAVAAMVIIMVQSARTGDDPRSVSLLPPETFSPAPIEEMVFGQTEGAALNADTGSGNAMTQDTSQQQTTSSVSSRLLPANISWFERAMWGEKGFLRKTGIAGPLTPENRKDELGVRRTMLTMHQIGGFLTMGLMTATVVYGQRIIDHEQRSDRDMHQTFLTLTIGSYAATGLLAIFSPPPMIRREGSEGTTGIHKTLAWVHFAGMVITPILGSMISRRSGSYLKEAHVHQVSGYLTTAVFAASMIILTF